ncbi:DNA polymerase I, partial [Patescibacteria group bacterium]|nr:DNA polymerase I [Patescibacteria group bacterium]
KARDMGYTETLFGRRRYFGGMTSHIPYIRAMAERMAVNAPIQGTAADIIKIAMRAADEELQKKKYKDDTHLILQVHDELIYEIKNEKIDDAIEIISEAMQNISDFSIPLEVSVSAGQNLGEMESYKKQKLL